MRKTYAVILSTLLIALGILLITIGIAQAGAGQEQYRPTVSLVLIAGFAGVFVLGLLFSRFTAKDYRGAFTTTILLLSVGMLLLGVFFAFVEMLVSPGVYRMLLLASLVLYGLFVTMNGVANYFLSQRVYRVYAFDFLRALPYAYCRYRT
ncbi:MAG: hypothetical protein AB1384_11425 [Actinomycetota bacterium]